MPNEKRSITGKIHVEGDITVHTAPSERQAQNDKERTQQRRDKIKRRIEATTLSFVVIVAFLNLWQAISNQSMATTSAAQASLLVKQTALLKSQIILDQRPIIKATSFNFLAPFGDTYRIVPAPTPGAPLFVKIVFSNIGKSAALNVTEYRRVVFGSSALDVYTGSHPGDPRHRPRRISAGEQDFITAFSLSDATDQSSNVNSLHDRLVPWDGSKPIIVFGTFRYTDAFGSKYCTAVGGTYIGGTTWAPLSEANPLDPCDDQPPSD